MSLLLAGRNWPLKGRSYVVERNLLLADHLVQRHRERERESSHFGSSREWFKAAPPGKEEGLETCGGAGREFERKGDFREPSELNSEFDILRDIEPRVLPADIGEIGDQRQPLAGGVRGSLSSTT